MTHEQMQEQAAQLVAFLEPGQVAEFAGVVRTAIANSYTAEQLAIIDSQLLSAGVDTHPPCRKKVPT
jgi:hypothetical protein